MDREVVDSSSIFSVGWEGGTLEIQFKDKDGSPARVYRYSGVPEDLYKQLMAAESLGSFFYRNIRNDYSYVQVH